MPSMHVAPASLPQADTGEPFVEWVKPTTYGPGDPFGVKPTTNGARPVDCTHKTTPTLWTVLRDLDQFRPDSIDQPEPSGTKAARPLIEVRPRTGPPANQSYGTATESVRREN
jgi:hypothetical protein